MKYLSTLTTIVITLFILVNPCRGLASESELPEGYVDSTGLDVLCKGMDAAIVGVSSLAAGVRAATATFTAFELYDIATEGVYSRSAECSMSWQDWANYYKSNPVNYNDFIKEHCGGNPLNCPGTYNVDQPMDCSTFIVCSDYAVDVLNGPFSVNDLVAPFAQFEMQYYYNDWNFDSTTWDIP
ncbi:hypothetical protein [Pseudidiomarina mangrovi]|uniref:hypothetical protein n=1 Tax=Pseudidiomarina mangrovi TaxID=2487133 RepID=UPI000FCA7471|nr:hypothetical protein [Pseudidiomarina mangrovi]